MPTTYQRWPLRGVIQLLAFLFFVTLPVSLYAHEGHDHAPTQSVEAWAQSEPRVTAESPNATIVGILKSERLWLYVDRTDSNEPLDLGIEINVNGASHTVRANGNGVYSVTAQWANKPGRYEIIFTLHHKDFNDLLVGTLDVPAANRGGDAPTAARNLTFLFYIITMLAAFYMILLWAKRQTSTPSRFGISGSSILRMAVITALALTTAVAMDEKPSRQPAVMPKDNPDSLLQHPSRLSDGSVDIPKPAQRVLMIRTEVAHIQPVGRTYILNGRVVQNPNTNALVQAEQTGRLEPPPQGFPPLGANVRKGELLAYLKPIMTPLELARRNADLRTLERDRFLTKRAYERVKAQMGTVDISASVMLETNRAQLHAFNQQIKALTEIPTRKLAVIAPMDGVIGASSVANARIVRPGDDLFRIWDPKSNWVEAINFHSGLELHIASAIAVLDDGNKVPLEYTSHGYLLQNQGLPLQFRPVEAASTLLVNELVKVYVQSNETLQGIRIPHDSVINRADGQPFVWVHADAERFERRTVSVMPLDDRFDIITAGVGADERLVVAGASLISKVQ